MLEAFLMSSREVERRVAWVRVQRGGRSCIFVDVGGCMRKV
jgi:hypothetical protein